MAYIDHASAFGQISQAPQGMTAVAGPEAAGFSPLEWSVIALARTDRLSSLSEPGPLARAFGGLFGLGRQSGLADSRLETLRRFAVFAWHKGYQLPVSETKRFLAEGFSKAQFETLMASIATRRVNRTRRIAA